MVVKLDEESYCTLGIPAKHSSTRLLKDNTYISAIPIKSLKESSRLFQRLRCCLRDVRLDDCIHD